MAEHAIPHFQNDAGVSVIEVAAHKFMCIGAAPPFDHPHVFLELGADGETICPYCSTLYRHSSRLHGVESSPPSLWTEAA